MLNLTVLALAAVVGFAADGAAVTAPAPTPVKPAVVVAAKPAVDPMEQTICRTMEETGSLIGGDRVCHTRREWTEMAREGRRTVEDTQNRSNMTGLPAH